MSKPHRVWSALESACVLYFDTGNHAPMRRAVVGLTGELADAARAMLKGGRHDGPCDFVAYRHPGDTEPGCIHHLRRWDERRRHLLRLTEAAVGRKVLP